MRSIYVGGGVEWGWFVAGGGGLERHLSREGENGKTTHLEIKSISPEEMKERIGTLPLVDCTYLYRPPAALGSLLLLNLPIYQAPTLLPMYIVPRYVFEDGFILQQ